MAEYLFDRRRWRFPIPQFLADALEDQHIRIYAHADSQNHSRNPGQSQSRTEISHETEQNDQVQDQRNVGIDSRAAIIHQHENQHREHSDNRSLNSGTDRIRPERRSDCPLFQVFDTRGQSTRIQNKRQVLGILFGHPTAADASLVANLRLNHGNFLDLVIQHDRQIVVDVLSGESRKTPSAFPGQDEIDLGPASLVTTDAGLSQIVAGYSRNARNEVYR